MAQYVDGFVLPVPAKNLAAYRRMARLAGRIFRELGALSYVESVADDVKPGKWTSLFDGKRMFWVGSKSIVAL